MAHQHIEKFKEYDSDEGTAVEGVMGKADAWIRNNPEYDVQNMVYAWSSTTFYAHLFLLVKKQDHLNPAEVRRLKENN